VTTRLAALSTLVLACILAPAAAYGQDQDVLKEVKDLRQDNEKLRQEIKDGLEKVVAAIKETRQLPASTDVPSKVETPPKPTDSESLKELVALIKQLVKNQEESLVHLKGIETKLPLPDSATTRGRDNPTDGTTVRPLPQGRFKILNKTRADQRLYVRPPAGPKEEHVIPALSEVTITMQAGVVEYHLAHETPRFKRIEAPNYEAGTDITGPTISAPVPVYERVWDPYRGWIWVRL
jgi:hypothetical protein